MKKILAVLSLLFAGAINSEVVTIVIIVAWIIAFIASIFGTIEVKERDVWSTDY